MCMCVYILYAYIAKPWSNESASQYISKLGLRAKLGIFYNINESHAEITNLNFSVLVLYLTKMSSVVES